MKLMTKELEREFEKQGDTSQKKATDTMVIAKFFNPMGAGSWYATEYNPETKIFFGFVDLGDPTCAELGSFSLDEMEKVKVGLGLGIERDLYFPSDEYTLQDIIDGKRP